MSQNQARVKVLKSTEIGVDGEWKLCFQYCRYEYNDEHGNEDMGYRFIWRKPDGKLQGARGQARIPSLAHAMRLMSVALSEGWGNNLGDEVGFGFPDDEE